MMGMSRSSAPVVLAVTLLLAWPADARAGCRDADGVSLDEAAAQPPSVMPTPCAATAECAAACDRGLLPACARLRRAPDPHAGRGARRRGRPGLRARGGDLRQGLQRRPRGRLRRSQPAPPGGPGRQARRAAGDRAPGAGLPRRRGPRVHVAVPGRGEERETRPQAGDPAAGARVRARGLAGLRDPGAEPGRLRGEDPAAQGVRGGAGPHDRAPRRGVRPGGRGGLHGAGPAGAARKRAAGNARPASSSGCAAGVTAPPATASATCTPASTCRAGRTTARPRPTTSAPATPVTPAAAAWWPTASPTAAAASRGTRRARRGSSAARACSASRSSASSSRGVPGGGPCRPRIREVGEERAAGAGAASVFAERRELGGGALPHGERAGEALLRADAAADAARRRR